MIDPADYFLPRASHDPDLEPWADMLPKEPRILGVTLFADVILTDREGAVHLLQPAAAGIDRIAGSEEEFRDRLPVDEDGWQLRGLADRCRAAGKICGERQCYAFTILPLLGGEYTVENIWTCPWREWFGFTADMYAQTKDQPDGARIRIQIVD